MQASYMKGLTRMVINFDDTLHPRTHNKYDFKSEIHHYQEVQVKGLRDYMNIYSMVSETLFENDMS